MLLRVIFAILLINISMLKCEQSPESLNLTITYGDTKEMGFKMNESTNKWLQVQLELMRFEQIRQGDLLDDLVANFNKINSLESNYGSNCAEATAISRRTGVYQILIPGFSLHPFLVSCDEDTHDGGWTVVLRREEGLTDFYLFWKDYKIGIGNVNGDHFIGLDKLHALTKGQDQELLITMEDLKGQQKYAKYNRFTIGNESTSYVLNALGEFSGDAGDSLSQHVNQRFTARDRDHDSNAGNCAEMFTGGWWYASCHTSNLLGKYNDSTFGKGINWFTFTGHNASLKRVQMMIRPRRH